MGADGAELFFRCDSATCREPFVFPEQAPYHVVTLITHGKKKKKKARCTWSKINWSRTSFLLALTSTLIIPYFPH